MMHGAYNLKQFLSVGGINGELLLTRHWILVLYIYIYIILYRLADRPFTSHLYSFKAWKCKLHN